VESVRIVVIFVPLKVTKAPELKLVPFTINWKSAPPWAVWLGLSAVIVGVVPEVAGILECDP
jgi:hypothetical protein